MRTERTVEGNPGMKSAVMNSEQDLAAFVPSLFLYNMRGYMYDSLPLIVRSS